MRYLLILILLCVSDLHAQVRGYVFDRRSSEPIAGAIVSLIDSAQQRVAVTSTKSNGEFRIRTAGRFLKLRSLGFSDTTIALPLNDSIIYLHPTQLGNADVTVTANRIATASLDLPISTVTVRSAEIQGRSPQGLDHILRAMPGVSVTESQVNIRGSSGYARAIGSRVLLLMDGMPLLSGDNGDMKFDAVPFPAVDRVEVIKGAGSALYGSNAIGGVINVLTRDPREVWKGGISLTGGQYDAPKYNEWKRSELTGRFYNLDAGLENKWDDFGALATVSYRKNEGYRIGDDLERYNIFAKGVYSSSPDLTLRASTLIANDQHGGWLYWKSLSDPYIDRDSLTAVNGRTHSNRANFNLGADYAFEDGKLWITKANYYTTEYITDSVPEREDDGAQSRSNVLSVESFINLEQKAPSSNSAKQFRSWMPVSMNETFGFSANRFGVSSSVLSDRSALGLAAFGQAEMKFLFGLSLSLGARFDHYGSEGANAENSFSPKLGLNYRPSESLAFRVSNGAGFRVPTLTERFIDSKMAGFTIIPNDSLRPERSESSELGARYQDEMLTIDAAIFNAEYENMIEPQFVGDKIQFGNITTAKQFGHEELVEVRPFSSDLLKARVGYTYVYSEDRTKKLVLPFRPRHLLQSRLEWRPGWLEVSGDFRYLSAYENIDSTLSVLVEDGEVRNASYVLDARVSLDAHALLDLPVKLTLQAQNLLNYYYVEIVGNMGPLRSYSLKIETTL